MEEEEEQEEEVEVAPATVILVSSLVDVVEVMVLERAMARW
jgi:hypothetical protein